MTLVGLLAGYFTLFAAGGGVVLLLTKGATRINLIECACLAWLFGTGVVSLTLWLGGILVSGLVLQLLVTLVCVALGFAGWRTKPRLRLSIPRPNGLVEWVLAALLLIELIITFVVSLKHTLGWDGLLNWEIKARYAFLNAGVLPPSYYADAGRAFSHAEYPLAIPFTELWLYLWMGAPHQFWIKTIFPLFYIFGALLIALFITRVTGKRWLGLMIALLVPWVPFVFTSPGGVMVGYADVPLSVFYVVALGYLVLGLKSNSSPGHLLFAGALTLIPWIKSEGVILWSLLAGLSLIVAWRRSQWRLALLSILPGLILICGWRVYLHAMHCLRPADFAWPSFQLLGSNLSRLGPIARITLIELTDTGLWSIFWLLALVAIVYLAFSRTLPNLILAIGVVALLIIYPLTYIFSAWPSYTAHITSSLPRLLLQIVPAAWLAIGVALSPTKPSAEIAASKA